MNTQASSAPQTVPRVLFCAADVGCGHGRAAMAMMAAMRVVNPALRPVLIDALQYTPGWFNRIYRDMYLLAAKHLPVVNGWLYDSTDVDGLPPHRGFASSVEAIALSRFCDNDQIRQADLIVCTHFLCARVLSRLRERCGLRAKLAVVVTDQHPHAVWRVPNADLFMVASSQAADEMTRNGLESHRTMITGIPIDRRFDRSMSKAAARRRQELPHETPVILLTGGGLGLGGIDQALDGILASAGEHFTVVVCGHNNELQKWLSKRVDRSESARCRILGVTTKMHELMSAADVMVGKPGGLTTAEAAARGLPMVLLRPIPGQEERNAQVLVHASAAIRCNDPFAAGQTAAALVAQGDALASMRKSARFLGRPGSARIAAQAALALCASRNRVQPITLPMSQ